MRFRFPTRSLLVPSLVLAFAFSVLTSIVVARYLGPQQHPAGTETTPWTYDSEGYLARVETTYDDKGRVTEKKEFRFDRKEKLRKRTTYTYLTGFKESNTSTTNYGPDGTTPEKTTNVDHDKDGNPTITTTTDYDKDGKEIGGTKRERDPKTGKEHCYKWDPKKQVYEEVPCPQETAQSSLQPPAKPSPGVRFTITDRDTRNNTCTCGESKTPCPCPSPSPTPNAANNQNARVETGGGLQTVTFDTPPGLIRLYLPDDMRAGDTISGTVVAEPKGQTPEERTRNLTELNGYVIELETPKKPDGTSNPKVKAEVTAPIPQLRVTLPPSGTLAPSLTNVSSANSSGLGITLTNTSGSFTIGGTTTVPIEIISLSLVSVEPLKVPQLPSIGQQGRPIEIIGPFQVTQPSTLMYGPPRATVEDFEKNTENVSGGFGLIQPLAESPRKIVFKAPTNVIGPIELYLKEGNKVTKGTYRNVGVNLTAPKTSLLKGESTELRVEVTGLQGITEPVPLHLTKGGVVTMQGGDVQTMSIKPAEVQSNGTFTTMRTVTGVQTGVWNATATIVVFDFCLQDDNNGNSLTFSSTTGDYIFCQGRSTVAGANPISLSTLNFLGTDFGGGVKVSASDVNDSGGNANGPVSIGPGASVTKNGAITVADFNYRVGSIHVQIDGYSHTGSASGYVYQQIAVPSNASPKKINFTITDRDTRNNTCACK
jgi:hypothetical protein